MSDSNLPPGSDAEWEELLRQLRRHPKPEPQPFFYARVHARLLASAGTATTWLPTWLRRPVYAAVLGALVLAMSGDGAVAAPASVFRPASAPTQQLSR